MQPGISHTPRHGLSKHSVAVALPAGQDLYSRHSQLHLGVNVHSGQRHHISRHSRSLATKGQGANGPHLVLVASLPCKQPQRSWFCTCFFSEGSVRYR
jgi:hypothetical protein